MTATETLPTADRIMRCGWQLGQGYWQGDKDAYMEVWEDAGRLYALVCRSNIEGWPCEVIPLATEWAASN